MKAYWATFDTSLKPAGLGARRRKLALLLRKHSVDLVAAKVGSDPAPAVLRLAAEAKGWPVVAIDDGEAMPDKAVWLAKLTGLTHGQVRPERPAVIYVTARASAEGTAQALRHPLVRRYLKRDEKGLWVAQAAEAAVELARERAAVGILAEPPAPSAGLPVIGQSECFRSAVERMCEVLRRPYCLVTGEGGVGKLYLIRALWKPPPTNPRVIVLPCGSFFKDYYVGGVLRRIGGGREAVDQLKPYFDQAEDGLLVLHHVQKLPTAIQEELVARMSSGPPGAGHPNGLAWVDHEELHESDITIVATSDYEPEFLRQSGRLIPELADKLCRRHVRIPSLSQRGPEDVRLLCQHLLTGVVRQPSAGTTPGEGKTPAVRLAPEVVEAFCRRSWPGNVSELIRVLEYAVRQCKGGVIRLRDLPPDGLWAGRQQTLDDIVRQAQMTAIQNALDQTGGSVPKAAGLLGKNRGNLHRLMSKLGMRTLRRTNKGRGGSIST